MDRLREAATEWMPDLATNKERHLLVPQPPSQDILSATLNRDMFSSSVRRVALTAPQIPIAPSLSNAAPRAATSQALSHRRSHQRRCSSSKPSSPADGSKGIQRQTVPPTGTQSGPDAEKKASSEFSKEGSKGVANGAAPKQDGEKSAVAEGEKKASTRSSKRKTSAKSDVKDGPMRSVPSVPSTQHISPGQICASSFFSLHRPISLTMAYPKTVTDAQFDAIFNSKLSTNKPNEVISTLTGVIKDIGSAQKQGISIAELLKRPEDQWDPKTDELRAAITAESYEKAETQHLDEPPPDPSLQFPRHLLPARYQPFCPPPPPVPMNTAESLAAGAEAAETFEPQQKTYTAVLTIEESTDANGDVTYMAHSSPFVAEDPPTIPTRFLERMKIRQERYEEYREQRSEERGMEAISVKRQRKLKMKKHKYKKLMRRTRNLRRRLDRN